MGLLLFYRFLNQLDRCDRDEAATGELVFLSIVKELRYFSLLIIDYPFIVAMWELGWSFHLAKQMNKNMNELAWAIKSFHPSIIHYHAEGYTHPSHSQKE